MERNCTNIYSLARKNTLGLNGKPLTQQKVAETLGVSRDAVAKWETGDCVPTEEHVAKLAQIYGSGIAYQHLLYHSALGPFLPEIEEMSLKDIVIGLVDHNYLLAEFLRKLVHVSTDGKIDKQERKDFEESRAFFRDLAGLCLSLSICGFGGESSD